MADRVYDAVIVGAGAAGGIVAGVLAEAGKSVLLLERGPKRTFSSVGRDHLRSQRHSPYGHNSGPDDLNGNPRVSVDPLGTTARIVRPHEGGYDNNATGLGGGTVVYGAQCWRFMPQDFRMASIYGVPDGSSLMDWPITYDDLAPHYERAEWEIGVAGVSGGHPEFGPEKRAILCLPSQQPSAVKFLDAERRHWVGLMRLHHLRSIRFPTTVVRRVRSAAIVLGMHVQSMPRAAATTRLLSARRLLEIATSSQAQSSSRLILTREVMSPE